MPCVVLALLYVAGSLQLPAQTVPADVPLAGRVINGATGAPLARVLVQANGSAVFTDHDGKFSIADTGSATALQLIKPGFASSPEQMDAPSLALPATPSLGVTEFALWPEAVLTGTVSGPEGEPVPKLNVSATRTQYDNGVRRSQTTGMGTTDSHGNFRIPAPAGDYVLQSQYQAPHGDGSNAVLPTEVPTRGSNTHTSTIHIESGQELHFDLHPVLAPAYHFTVPFEALPERQVPLIMLQTANGARYQPGGIHITPAGLTFDLPAGSYRLVARIFAPDGLRLGESRIDVPNHDATGALIHLEAVPSIPVEVAEDPADQSSAAASGRAAAQPPHASSLNLQVDPVNDDLGSADEALRPSQRGGGPAFFAPPGSYRLSGGDGSGWVIQSATYGGTDLLHNDLVVGPNTGREPIRVVVSHRTGSISGITHVHGVAASCWVVLVGENGSLPRFLTRKSDAAGRLTLAGIAPGAYHALALPFLHSADYADASVLEGLWTYVGDVTVSIGATATLSLEAVPIEDLLR